MRASRTRATLERNLESPVPPGETPALRVGYTLKAILMRCAVKGNFSLVLTLLFVLSGSVWAQGWTVSPGEGVGALTLGMTSSQAKAILTPTDIVGSPNNPLFIKYGEELVVQYEASKIAMISLHSKTFQTKQGPVTWIPYKGLAIGAPWNTVVNQIPGNKKSRQLETAKGYPIEVYHAYLALGLGVRTKGGNVVQVDVWDRK
jgi:hypothetical protein